ncbi:MAG: CocE/NonD family hydrolase [Candidatus Aminicenantes bacterium]|nr:CocE/NonD family hydrolase [Candidatus Aminicenantes bacterium]
MRIGRQQAARSVLLICIFLLFTQGSRTAVSQPSEAASAENGRAAYNVKIPMRDGIKLSADIYFPPGSGPFPAILSRTPYDNSMYLEYGRLWANRGFAFVAQDCRGRYDSEGEWEPIFNEPDDGRDTLQWIVSQKWSNGKVGMIGGSYGGWVQWLAAPDAGDALTAMVPMVAPPNPFLNVPYTNGALTFGMGNWALLMDGRTNQLFGKALTGYDYVAEVHNVDKNVWRVPVVDFDEFSGRRIPWWKEWVLHDTYDDYWKRLGYQDKFDRISAPALNVTGWYDVQLIGPVMNYSGMIANGKTPESRKQKLLIGPWGHAVNQKLEVRDFGSDAVINLDSVVLRWFDYWLKGIDTGILDEAPIRLFVMGANRWQNEWEWPLARTEWTKYYLHSRGKARSLGGDGRLSISLPETEPADTYDYDPADPVLNKASETFAGMGSESLVFPGDLRDMHRRQDVLVYETPPLEEDVEIIGPVTLELHASSSARDTDWVARLSDVFPDGTAWALCGTILRARFRESLENPTLLEPGKIYTYILEFWPTANHFFKGHRIRLDITSSAFPTFDRNLNTGEHNGTSTQMQVAHQTVYHTKDYPSHLVLPVIPEK